MSTNAEPTSEDIDVFAFGRWYTVPGACVSFDDSCNAVVTWQGRYTETETRSRHGRSTTYQKGCRCVECRDTRAQENRRAYLKRSGAQ